MPFLNNVEVNWVLPGNVEEHLLDAATEAAAAQADAVAEQIAPRPKLARDAMEALLARVAARQEAVGYDGDYQAWLERITPPDLE